MTDTVEIPAHLDAREAQVFEDVAAAVLALVDEQLDGPGVLPVGIESGLRRRAGAGVEFWFPAGGDVRNLARFSDHKPCLICPFLRLGKAVCPSPPRYRNVLTRP